jgi:hypothetical protein
VGRILAGAVLISLAALAVYIRHPKIATSASAEEAAIGSARDPIAKVEAERLAQTTADFGPLNDPEKLADVCLKASVACGFELPDDVWNRPESQAPLTNATAEQALSAFIGRDYRLAWIGAVLHVFPAATDGKLPLDATLSADVSMNSSSREPAETIHDIAVKLGLQMPAPRPRELRTNLIGSSTMPIKGSARNILDYLTRPALLHPSSYVAVYGPGRAGILRWYWGEPPPW